jgi:hypothetical protein
MVAEEFFENYHNFNPIWVKNASINVKKYWYTSQKRKLLRYLINKIGLFAGFAAIAITSVIDSLGFDDYERTPEATSEIAHTVPGTSQLFYIHFKVKYWYEKRLKTLPLI